MRVGSRPVRMMIGHQIEIAVPERYQEPPRLRVWYKFGFNQAQRGFTADEGWLGRVGEDTEVLEAYRDGRRAGKASRDQRRGADSQRSSASA